MHRVEAVIFHKPVVHRLFRSALRRWDVTAVKDRKLKHTLQVLRMTWVERFADRLHLRKRFLQPRKPLLLPVLGKIVVHRGIAREA